MPFVRAKKQGERTYYYLVTSERKAGRVRQKTLCYLGHYPTVEAALECLPTEIERKKQTAQQARERSEKALKQMHPNWLARNNGIVPRPKRSGMQRSNKLFGRYWESREFADSTEAWARELQARLDKLRALVESGQV